MKREVSESCDLAVLAVNGNHNLPIYPVYDGEPSEGADVALFGYRGHQYTRENGTASNLKGTIHWFQARVHQGMSGGPIVVSDDGMAKTIAIIGGIGKRDNRRTWATGLPKIREFIAGLGLEIAGCAKPKKVKLKPKPKTRPAPLAEINYDKLASIIIARMKADESFRGPQGKQGPAGPQGDHGHKGPDGRDGPNGKNGTNGKSGMITIRLVDEKGKELSKTPPLKPGRVVELDITRFLREAAK